MKKESKTLILSRRLCIAGVLSALGFVIMYLGALSGVFDLCAVVVGALCCIFAVIELGGCWPWLVASVTGVLCLVLLPDKFAALEYIALGGLYPILKSHFEKLPRIFSWIAKLISLNVMLTACLLIAKYLMGIKDDWVAFSPIVYLLANGFFLLYDVALTKFISVYVFKVRNMLKIKL